MPAKIMTDVQEGIKELARFRAGEDDAALFTYPIPHPSQPTGFCPCDEPLYKAIPFYVKAALLNITLQMPFNQLSVWLLRKMGATIGENVYISAGAWVDPIFPDLLTIEDNVLLGAGVKIAMHEFRTDEFVVGRVTIRRGAILGGFCLIGPGVEIGENATVAGGAVVARDVPPNAIAGGNTARVIGK